MIRFETSVRIGRSIDDVFTYLSDPLNFPAWNSAVQTVRKTSPEEDTEPGSTFSMDRGLPGGLAQNDLEVATHERPTVFSIRTTSGPTPFVYVYRLASIDAGTEVRLDAEVELGAASTLLAPLARRAVRGGVDQNLASLKTLMERGGDARRR